MKSSAKKKRRVSKKVLGTASSARRKSAGRGKPLPRLSRKFARMLGRIATRLGARKPDPCAKGHLLKEAKTGIVHGSFWRKAPHDHQCTLLKCKRCPYQKFDVF
jgi:hypothetical protein